MLPPVHYISRAINKRDIIKRKPCTNQVSKKYYQGFINTLNTLSAKDQAAAGEYIANALKENPKAGPNRVV